MIDKEQDAHFEMIHINEDDEDVNPEDGDAPQDDSPARISIYVTSTINPGRPRTVRAGYNYKTGTLTVVFRPDGQGKYQWWNYYDVPIDMWEKFRDAPSKGRYLRQSGLDNWPSMGEPDMAAMSSNMLRSLASSLDAQRYLKGKQSRRLRGPRVEAAKLRYIKGLGKR